jgi:hypothetical protein
VLGIKLYIFLCLNQYSSSKKLTSGEFGVISDLWWNETNQKVLRRKRYRTKEQVLDRRTPKMKRVYK